MQARSHRRLRISLPISNIELKPERARRFCLLLYQFTYIQH